jgi:hypothetical protein
LLRGARGAHRTPREGGAPSLPCEDTPRG